MKIGDLVMVKVVNKQGLGMHQWLPGMITEVDVRDYSGECDPWTSYKVLVGDAIITTHTGKIEPWTKNMADSLDEIANQ